MSCTCWQLIRYFLWLGTSGFGGPIALAGYIQRDLVEQKQWFTKDDYVQGFALAHLCPGPFATQLAIYLGWVRFGILGATCVGIAFVLPSFLMVLGISVLYAHYGSLSWMQAAFYGIGAAVISIIIRSCVKLAKMTNTDDYLLWTICTINALVTAFFASELVWVFLLSGIIAMFIKAPPQYNSPHVSIWPFWLSTGIQGTVTTATLLKIVSYFAWTSLFVFGSGLAIVPFLHGGVVDTYHWLTEREFIDAVAVAMITPGPAVITVAFIGYLVAGIAGAILAAVGVFLPVYLFVILLAPHYRRYCSNLSIKAFVNGVTAAATGAIGGSAFIIGKQAITDIPTALILVITSVLLFASKHISEPLLIVGAGIIGFLLKNSSFG